MHSITKHFILSVLLILSCSIFSQAIDLKIKNIRNTKGQICVAIFVNEADFKAEKTCWEMKYSAKEILGNEMTLQIQIKPGRYGISVLHDENNNGKMDYNFFGIPNEGFGFSDYYHRGIKKPHFDDFNFYIEKNEMKKIIVIMKYF